MPTKKIRRAGGAAKIASTKREKGSTKSKPKAPLPSSQDARSGGSPSKQAPAKGASSSKGTSAKTTPTKGAPVKPSTKGSKGGPVVIELPSQLAPAPAKNRRPALPDEGPSRCGTVALVGRPNVGKSSIMNALLGQKIAATTHKPQTTRRALRGVLTEGRTQLVFVDTPGLHNEQGKSGLLGYMIDEALDAAGSTDVICFVVEVDRKRQGVHKDDADALVKVMAKKQADVPVVLVINKVDVLEDKATLLPLLATWASSDRFAGYVPVSAHDGDNLSELVRELSRLVPKGEHLLPADSLTDQSERDIAAELIREKVMLELHEELPYRSAVIVEHFDEARRDDAKKPLVHIAGVVVVEKDSHKAMVIGKAGARIKAIGQRARKELEHLLMCQVHLELFVRVEKDWTQTGAGLKKLGYGR
jgi:GTP-binding protein Era